MRNRIIVIGICIVLFFSIAVLNVYLDGKNSEKQKEQKQENVLQTGTLYNVWIMENGENTITAYIEGKVQVLSLQESVNKDLSSTVADLKLKKGVVEKIVLKKERVSGRVLSVDEEQIEIKGYGKLPLDKNYKVYKVYGEVKEKKASDVMVGYNRADFVVANGQVCAGLLTKPLKIENIRVLLKTTGYEKEYHETVVLTGTGPVFVYRGNKKTEYGKGEKIVLSPSKDCFGGVQRIRIVPKNKKDRIMVNSIERGSGIPCYRGYLEISWKKNKGLLLVNELPFEEYLYGVIGSEMPVSYGVEALMVQAVCARSYAYKQLLLNACGKYGAHVDDSVSYQVYNNYPECKETIEAVDQTAGKILKYQGDVVTTYYFSTSCGMTADASDVWFFREQEAYLEGQPQNKEQKPLDLSVEKDFWKFIQDNSYESYDREYPWYRWNVTMTKEQLQNVINERLQGQYERNENWILVKQKDGGFVSKSLDNIGEIKDIKILERGKSGVVKAVKITGSKETIKVISEYNIRMLLAPEYSTIFRNDASQIDGMSMLPSGFFHLSKSKKDQTFTFCGGGYGHGVGMSQNGAKTMADKGIPYEEILQHYYPGTVVAEMEE